MYERCYSSDYQTARRRFLAAVATSGGSVQSYPVEDESSRQHNLYMDVASIGSGSNLTVLTSGLHGVEGYFGSAVQLALLEQLQHETISRRFLLIHAINPYGFQHSRRVDANNVDLNRNFPVNAPCAETAAVGNYAGAPDGYHQLNDFLNPCNTNYRLEFFTLKAIHKIARYGMRSLKESIASGQYEYPQGLFYGGADQSATTRVITSQMRSWVGSAAKVFHVDLHTGLGCHGAVKLLANSDEKAATLQWFRDTFGEARVESLKSSRTAYPVHGQFGAWLQAEFGQTDYRFIGAEFGTYPVLKVVAALRNENRYHLHGNPDSEAYKAFKKHLRECFCPTSPQWRELTVSTALALINDGVNSL